MSSRAAPVAVLLALGVVGCRDATTTTGTSLGDDDDEQTTDPISETGPDPCYESWFGCGPPDLFPAKMTFDAQFGVLGGAVVDAVYADGVEYRSTLRIHLGPSEWDPNDPTDDGYCTVSVALAEPTLGLLDAEPVRPPYAEVAGGAAVDNDCVDRFTLPEGFDANTLVTASPGWSAGVASAWSARMQADLEARLPTEYADRFLGGYVYLPILTEPLQETFYGLGVRIDADANVLEGTQVPRAEVEGGSVLPDGYYVVTPLIIVSG